MEAWDGMGVALIHSGFPTMQDHVYAHLSEALMAGVFRPGEPIAITDLARQFGTSAMPVRDAVRRLHAEGALQIEPQRGVRVRLAEEAEVAELIRLRLNLEPGLAAAAATRLSDEALQALDETAMALGDALGDADPLRLLQLNKALHFILYEAAAQPVTLQIVRMLWARMGPVIRVYVSNPAFAITPETARRLVVAVRARDSRAARRWVIETIRTPAAILLADYARYVGEPAARPGYRREPAVGA